DDRRFQALGRADPPSTQPTFEEVRVGTREARIRRAEEAEQVAPAPAEPGVAEERENRPTEGGLRRPDGPLERMGYAERSERRLEGSAYALQGRADDQDLLRRRTGAQELEDLVADQLERRTRAGALEEADPALGRRRRRRRVLEKASLEMCERRVRVVGVPWWQLLDPPHSEPGEGGGRALER